MSDSQIATSESNKGDSTGGMIGGILLGVILAPLAALIAFIVYSLFARARIHYRVFAAAAAIYTVLLVIAVPFVNVFSLYIESWKNIADSIMSSGLNLQAILSAWGFSIVQQAPLSIAIGLFLGTIISWWKWRSRASWMKIDFRLTPWEAWKKKRNIADIALARVAPPDGRTIGVNERGEKVIQSQQESVAHTFIAGGSGSGKTKTLLAGARDYIMRGEPLVCIDFKGSPDFANRIEEMATRYNRPFYHWVAYDPRQPYPGPSATGASYYDPLGRGGADRRTNLVMAGREWSEDYYRTMIHAYLNNAFAIALATPDQAQGDSIGDIMSLLDPAELKKRSLHVVGDPYFADTIAAINYLTDKKIDGKTQDNLDSMQRQLSILRDSVHGRWLRKDPEGKNDINFFDIAQEGAVVVFTLDSATYAENSRILGDLIIEDLKTVTSELRDSPSRYPLNIIIDEFSVVGSQNIIGLIARSRDAGMPVTITTQALGDLRAVSPAFMDQLLGVVQSFIIHRANTLSDAEIYAGLTGKKTKQVFRQSVEQSASLFGLGRGGATGRGTIEEVEDYVVSPSEIQSLKTGECIFICKSPQRLERVRVIIESEQVGHGALPPKSSAPVETETKPANFIPPHEDLSKYKLDPAINNKAPDASKATEDGPQEVPIRPADPKRIRELFNRSTTDLKEGKIESIRELESAPKAENPAPLSSNARNIHLPHLKDETVSLPAVFPKPSDDQPARRNQGLPELPGKQEDKSTEPAATTKPPKKSVAPIKQASENFFADDYDDELWQSDNR